MHISWSINVLFSSWMNQLMLARDPRGRFSAQTCNFSRYTWRLGCHQSRLAVDRGKAKSRVCQSLPNQDPAFHGRGYMVCLWRAQWKLCLQTDSSTSALFLGAVERLHKEDAQWAHQYWVCHLFYQVFAVCIWLFLGPVYSEEECSLSLCIEPQHLAHSLLCNARSAQHWLSVSLRVEGSCIPCWWCSSAAHCLSI